MHPSGLSLTDKLMFDIMLSKRWRITLISDQVRSTATLLLTNIQDMSMNAFCQLIILSVLLSSSPITGNTLMFYFHTFVWRIWTKIYILVFFLCKWFIKHLSVYVRCAIRSLTSKTRLKACVNSWGQSVVVTCNCECDFLYAVSSVTMNL